MSGLVRNKRTGKVHAAEDRDGRTNPGCGFSVGEFERLDVVLHSWDPGDECAACFSTLCGAWPERGGCRLPSGHNRGMADLPANHLFPEDGPDLVNHPPHYADRVPGIEAIEVCEHFGFCLGNVIKYIWRAGFKGDDIEDLEKALWYLKREIETRKQRKAE